MDTIELRDISSALKVIADKFGWRFDKRTEDAIDISTEYLSIELRKHLDFEDQWTIEGQFVRALSAQGLRLMIHQELGSYTSSVQSKWGDYCISYSSPYRLAAAIVAVYEGIRTGKIK